MSAPATIAAQLAAARQRLTESDSARLDAEILLAHVLGVSRTHLHTWPEEVLDPAVQTSFSALIERRATGEPVAYLVGEQEFWSLPLRVTPDTLIPRPETELLVEQALARIPARADWRIADLGTGSGAIALALAHECPGCTVTATDRSEAALAVARDNARQLHISNVTFLVGEWFAPLQGHRYHVIVANPPYVAVDDPHLQQGDVRFEPIEALHAGPGGLDDLARLVANAPAHLEAGGWLLLEHGFDQGEAVRTLLAAQGLGNIETVRDHAGHERLSLAKKQ
ncbi:MAG TPA: peptide chain release factor N(5)-glutamine methyltransferase [Gammaproteobacteria bacterium]|nr:peptide chain release factor N(5)-glutamine methyltransferase [Gammaproteobacteria bacterium]